MCSEPDCEKDVYSRGLCVGHYQKRRIAGMLPAYDERRCATCGASFVPGNARGLYCSTRCKDKAPTKRRRAAVDAQLAERRCVECGDLLTSRSTTKALTCGKACSVAYANRKRAEARSAARPEPPPCAHCGGPMPEARRYGSKFCSRACGRAARAASDAGKTRAREANLMRLYGISAEQFDALLAAQGGVCAICKNDEWGGKDHRPHVDHDHATGEIRGLLCYDCNLGLGRFRDDPQLLLAAAAYLSATSRGALATV